MLFVLFYDMFFSCFDIAMILFLLLDHVLFSGDMSQRLRDTLHTLMRDCDRRQELLQELIATNNQLRLELRRQTEHRAQEQAEAAARRITSVDTTIQTEQYDDDEEDQRTVVSEG